MATKTQTVILAKDRETKNTVRFSTADEGVAVSTLYVGKEAVAELGDPDSVKVTVEPA